MLLNKKSGFTLIEMLVTLGIMAVLASVAIPYAQTMIKRTNEMELQSSLRTIRTAIDKFRDDWTAGKISKFCDCAGESGYPKKLEILVEGADAAGFSEKKIKYLRRVPKDPFADKSIAAAEQWGKRSYNDSPYSTDWGGEDVYDVYTKSRRTASDGSAYSDW